MISLTDSVNLSWTSLVMIFGFSDNTLLLCNQLFRRICSLYVTFFSEDIRLHISGMIASLVIFWCIFGCTYAGKYSKTLSIFFMIKLALKMRSTSKTSEPFKTHLDTNELLNKVNSYMYRYINLGFYLVEGLNNEVNRKLVEIRE